MAEPVPGHGAPGPADEAAGADRGWLGEAIGLSRRCPPSATAFAVGAVVVGGDGSALATGYSREGGPHDHAEEAALAKLDPADSRLAGATLYSSLEPCRFRASRPRPCAELIIEAGLRRVVIAWLEPPVFAPGGERPCSARPGSPWWRSRTSPGRPAPSTLRSSADDRVCGARPPRAGTGLMRMAQRAHDNRGNGGPGRLCAIRGARYLDTSANWGSSRAAP